MVLSWFAFLVVMIFPGVDVAWYRSVGLGVTLAFNSGVYWFVVVAVEALSDYARGGEDGRR